jgi:hypothetical protein
VKSPSASPTLRPTLAPTASPTVSPLVLAWNTKANSTLYALKNEVTASDGLALEFMHYVSPTLLTTYGSCPDWNGFVYHSLATQLASLTASTLTFSYVARLSEATSSHAAVCSDQTVVSNVLRRLAGFVGTSYSATCGSHEWTVAACSISGSVAMCLDCSDPCTGSSVNSTLSPCTSASSTAPTIQYVLVQFDEPETAPAIMNVSVSATAKSSIQLAVTVAAEATVYCNTYDSSSSSTTPGSNTEIMQFGIGAVTVSNISSLSLTKLNAATTYKVYCVVVAADGTQTEYATVSSTSWAVTTSCCRGVVIGFLARTVTAGVQTANFLSVTTDAPASSSIVVSLTVKSSSNTTSQVLVPGAVHFGTVVSTSSVGLQSLTAGTYSVVAAIGGASKSQFRATCTGGCSFTVIAVDKPTPAPSLSSAQFSSDGSTMTITFTAPTNRAQMTGAAQFTCSQLFSFSGSNRTQCQWSSDSTTVTASTSGSASWALEVGSKVTYAGRSFLTAVCTASTGNCTSWPRVAATVLTVTAPSSVVVPTVAVSAPASVGACDSLYLDLSASVGNGGRHWSSKSITVVSSNGDVSALQSFLTNTYLASSVPVPVPSGLLQAGVTYTFSFSFCNFVGGCGQNKKTVSTLAGSAPLVAVIGPSVRSMYRNSSLSLTSNAFVSGCDGSIVTEGLSYQWRLSPTVSASSVSKDPSVLLLNSYVLTSNSIYTVTLTVTIASTGVYSSTSVQVLVLTGDIIPVLPGGSSRSVRTLSTILLDASKSVDTDVGGGLVGTAAGLKFSWSCVQTYPTISSSCSLQTNGTSILLVYAPAGAANTSSTMTLSLRDSKGTRSAQTRITVSVVTPVTPIVTISNSSTGKVNPGSKLLLLGVVSLASSSTQLVGTASWSVDSSAVDLTTTALVSTSASLASSSTAATSASVPLLLSANSVPAGSVLTFTLAASAGSASSSATITIAVNSPPTPGTLTISPSSGVAMTDSFTFLASLWVDSDTPLSYQFGYVASATGTVMVMQSQSETNFGSTLLPAGSGAASSLTCVAEIYDSYDANTTVYNSIQVTSSGASLSTSLSTISSQLSGSLGSVNGIKKLVALSVSALTQVNCTAASNCTALNRASCQAVSNMCGPCLSGFYGSSGVSNTACLSYGHAVSLLQSAYSSSQLSCKGKLTCPSGYECSKGKTCVIPSKSCLNECSGKGECIFVQSATGSVVSNCTVYDPSCEAECSCNDNRYGDDCSLSESELSTRQSAMETIAASLTTLTGIENPSQSVVSGWLSSVAGVTKHASDLTNGSITSVHLVADAILDSASSLGMSVESTANLLGIIDSAASTISSSTSRRRRLSSLSSTTASISSAAVIGSTSSLLTTYGAFVTNSLTQGQDGVTVVKSNYRLTSQLMSSANVTLPQTDLESVSGSVLSSVKLSDELLSSGSIPVTMFTLSSALYGNSEYDSAPVTMQVSSSACSASSSDSCTVTMVMQNSNPVTYVDEAPLVFTTRCSKYDYTVHSYVCPDETIVTATCNGTASVIVTKCPHTSSSPSCASVTSELGYSTNSNCELVSYTASEVVCSCQLSGSSSRRLTTNDDYYSSATDDSTTTSSVSLVSVAVFLSEGMAQTWMSAKDLNASSLRKGWWVLVTIGCFFGAVLLAMYVAHRADSHAKSISPDTIEATLAKSGHVKMSKTEGLPKRRKTSRYAAKRGAANNEMVDIASELEKSLPEILRRKPFMEKFFVELKRYHRWFGIVFYYSEDFPRVLRIISLVGNVVSMLFVQAVTYNMTNPDDGSCNALLTKPSCLSPRSPYGESESKCYWEAVHGYGTDLTGLGTCHFREPSSDMKVVLFVAIFAALLSTPFSYVTDWIVMNVLSARTVVVAPTNAANSGLEASDGSSEAGVLTFFRPRRMAALNRNASQESNAVAIMSSKGAPSGTSSAVELPTTLEVDYETLVCKIKAYREALTPAQLKEFDGE